MGSIDQGRRFLNYPEPLKAPDAPFKDELVRNPAISGWFIVVAAWLMERFSFICQPAWHNAGFGALRKITQLIEDYEPWFEPTVIPLPDQSPQGSTAAAMEIPRPAHAGNGHTKQPGARYYSAADYRALYLSGELTPTDVVRAILPLIRRDTSPPGTHSIAWFETQAELVLRAAAASTERYREKRSLGPLDGVPTGVKDEYDMDEYRTCLGSRNDYTGSLVDPHPDANAGKSISAWSVRRVEASGAIILGKLSMHEFGLDTSGNNPVRGTPPNPHNPGYYTGGSSSGTGYAVASGLIPFGFGSDGGGSIRIPASMCGVFGLKPTSGRVSFRPGQNHCITCAVLGPLAADIRSLATAFEVIAAPHPTSSFPPMPPLRLSASLPSPREKVLGIPTAWFARAEPGVQRLCRAMIDRLVATHGYTEVDIAIPLVAQGQTAHAITVLADAATLLPETKGLTAANRILIALGRMTRATDLILAQKLRRCLMQHLAYLWQKHGSDMLIITPTTACGGWPVRNGEAELRYGISDGDTTVKTMEYVWLANFCGIPSLSVPAGFVIPEGKPRAGEVAEVDVEGRVPVGLMAMGEWCSEERLLQFGLEAEQIGAGQRAQPPIWVDVVELAKKSKPTEASAYGGL